MSALGQASGLCPRIEKSLKTAQPTGYETDAAGAFEFLTQKAAALQQAGFTVLLPAWWTGKGTKLKLTTKAKLSSPKLSGSGALSLDQLVRFEWQVALGDQVLDEAELEALASLKQPLVNIRGQWVQLSPEEIKTAIDIWKRKAESTATLREVVQLALGSGDGTASWPSKEFRLTAGSDNSSISSKARRSMPNASRRQVLSGNCGRINNEGTRGWRFCGVGDLAPVWPMTWGSARRCKRWR